MSDANLTAKVSIEGIDSSISSMDKMTSVAKSLEKATAALEYAVLSLGKSKKATAQVVDDFGNVVQSTASKVKKANKDVSDTETVNNKATNSYKGFGGAVRNTSYQIQDFATQVGAGTSATVSLGQQLPQLLSGFGLWGVLIGTATAILVPLISNLGLFQTKAEKIAKSLDSLSKSMKETAKTGDDIAEFARDFTATSANGFEVYVDKYNKASASQRKEMQEWLKLKLEVEQAKLYDVASEMQGRAIDFAAGTGFEGQGTTQFGPSADKLLELKIKYDQLSDSIDRMKKAVSGDFAGAMAGGDKQRGIETSIQQKIDSLRAEATYYGVSNAEKEKGTILAELEANAKRANIGFDKESLKVKELLALVDAKHTAEQQKRINDYTKEQNAVIALSQAEEKRLTMSTREFEKYTEELKRQADVAKSTTGWNPEKAAAYEAESKALLKVKQATDDINYANQRTFQYGAVNALRKYGEEATNVATQIESAFGNAFRGIEDAFLSFVNTGKASFRSLTISILNDLARIAIRQGITGPLASALGSAIGGMFAPSGVSLGTQALGANPSASTGFGINPSSGGAGIRAYAVGTNYVPNDGLAYLHKGEAVVPAKYNPSAGGGSGNNFNVSVNVNMANDTTTTTTNSQDAKQLGVLISNVVKSEMLKQQRPGGILSGA